MNINKEDLIISTLPIKPQESTSVGMMIAPTISNVVGDLFECSNFVGINTMNTYKNKDIYIDRYKQDLVSGGLTRGNTIIDENVSEFLLNKVYELVSIGIIKIKKKEKNICNCGMVDCLSHTINNNGKLYRIDNGYPICNNCNSTAIKVNQSVLCLELISCVDDSIKIFPDFLEKEMKEFSLKYKGLDLLVSKTRDTGYSIILNGESYNIDIDFLWSLWFSLFYQNNQIIVASNHQLFNLYVINYLSKMTCDKNLIFIATPYLLERDNLSFETYYKKSLAEYKKLFILYQLKWGQKDCYLSDSILKYLYNANDSRLNSLYEILKNDCLEIIRKNECAEDILKKMFVSGMNMQQNIRTMKKMGRGNYV